MRTELLLDRMKEAVKRPAFESYNSWQALVEGAIAALEAVEAREAELRETINSVAVCQKHVTEITAGACMICEIEQLREQMQEIVLMAARKHRPAYDEQQRVIMELRARIAELEQQVPKWVPVHVQVPPEDHSILLMNGLPFIGRKRDGYRGEPNQDMNTYRATCCGKIGPAVTHWMPLPAAPATKEPE